MTPEEQQETLAMIQAELESSTRVSIATDIRIIRIAAQVATGALLLIAGAMLSNAAPIESLPLPTQRWYTADIPTPEGVFPVEVYAPALPRIVASDLVPIIEIGDPPRLVDVPEPGTLALIVVAVAVMYVGYRIIKTELRMHAYYDALWKIAEVSEQEHVKNIARKALEEE